MDVPARVTFKGLERSTALEAYILDEIGRLQRFSTDIQRCHVVVEVPHHQHQGRVYQIRIEILVPRGDIVVSRGKTANHTHEDPYVAVRDAFHAATRQLEDHARKLDGRVKTHQPPLLSGTVARFIAGADYGFIDTSDGEVYFHRHSVVDDGFARLSVGDAVRLNAVPGEKGLQASTVHRVGKHHPAEN